MSRSDSVLIAIGGGDLAKTDALERIFDLLDEVRDARVAVMTVATNQREGVTTKYNSIFRKRNVRHVDMVHVWQREDAFSETSVKKIKSADAIFFTGGDQLNVTGLMGGSPLHDALYDRVNDGVILAGSSAGAAMMSAAMITGGNSDAAPRVGCVEIAPGMALLNDTIIDTHFSQRGRHGRLMTAVAHNPQDLGIGLDELTAIILRRNTFEVVGAGSVTVMDGSRMTYSDLVYKKDREAIGLFGLCVHVLPNGYKFDLRERQPIAPKMKGLVRAAKT
jgi:cyanophycinase